MEANQFSLVERAAIVDELSQRVMEHNSRAGIFWRFFSGIFKFYHRAAYETLVLREQRLSLQELKHSLWEENLLMREREFQSVSEETVEALSREKQHVLEQVQKAEKELRQATFQLEDLIRQRDVVQSSLVELTSKLAETKKQFDEVTEKLVSGSAEFHRRESVLQQTVNAEERLVSAQKSLSVVEQTLFELNGALVLVRAEILQFGEARDELKKSVVSKVSVKKLKQLPVVCASYDDVISGRTLDKIPDVIKLTTEQYRHLSEFDSNTTGEHSRLKEFRLRLDALKVLKGGDIRVFVEECECSLFDLHFPTSMLERIRNGGKTDDELRLQSEVARLSTLLKPRLSQRKEMS